MTPHRSDPRRTEPGAEGREEHRGGDDRTWPHPVIEPDETSQDEDVTRRVVVG
jgi:hypothetical protein